MPQINLSPAHLQNKKKLNQVFDEYMISSRIGNYFELPESIGAALDNEDDFYIIKLRPALQLSKDAKIVRGIQQRIMLAIKNSIVCHRFAGYDSRDTFISVNAMDDTACSNISNMGSLENRIDQTSCKTVRLFSERMNSGLYSFAANMGENQARIYLHRAISGDKMFYYLEPFIESESDRDWLLLRLFDKIELATQVHF